MFPTWYRFQITSVLSILHRLTGIALAVGSIVLAWWLVAAATNEHYFNFVSGLFASPVGLLVLLGAGTMLVISFLMHRGQHEGHNPFLAFLDQRSEGSVRLSYRQRRSLRITNWPRT